MNSMLRSLFATALAVSATICSVASGQSRRSPAIRVSDSDGAQHRLNAISPMRTPHWNSAYRFQSVVLDVIVDPVGRIVSAKPNDGPKELYEAAQSEARTWKYRPFIRKGKPVEVTFTEYVRVLPDEDLPTTHVPFPQIKNWNSLVITLTRGPCYGTCPAYQVEIHGDGSVVYTGSYHVAVKGRQSDRISPQAVSQIFTEFQKADFFSLRDKYVMPVTDNPTYVISISFDGKTKSVTDYVGAEIGMPQCVTDLEDAIDRTAHTGKWIAEATKRNR